ARARAGGRRRAVSKDVSSSARTRMAARRGESNASARSGRPKHRRGGNSIFARSAVPSASSQASLPDARCTLRATAQGALGGEARGNDDGERMKAAANARSTVVSDPRWTAVAERDERATFVYSVASTGIYCRPSCPARRPRPENVAFHPSPVAAELAGFRPCKRCMPREALSEAVARPVIAMCKRIEESEHAPSLRELARHVGLSEGHAHRSFVRATGLTPKAYRDAVLRRRLQHELRERKTVTEAIYTSGFNSAGRFYEHVARALGMSPSTYRAGAHGLTIRFA